MMIELNDILIRTVAETDAENLHRLVEANRERLCKYLPITLKENETLGLTRQYLKRKTGEAKNRTTFTCVIVDKASESFVGIIIIKKIDWHAGDCELGYFICRDFEGQGITSAAVKAVCKHCFTKLRLRTVKLIIGPDNVGSIRVAEKNGFVKTSVIPGGHKDSEGNPIDVGKYELTKQGAAVERNIG